MADELTEAIAAEEHRRGMPYGDDPSHCYDCAKEAEAQFRVNCLHDGEQADITGLGDANRRLLCQSCGLMREVPSGGTAA